MPIYKFVNNELTSVKETDFKKEGIKERTNLQNAIKNNIAVILEDCLVISEEFSKWSESNRRIDLLAIDKLANLVVIELKRDETGAHMDLQALRYASMVSTMTYSQAVKIYKEYIEKNNVDIEAEENLLEFLEWDEPAPDDFAPDVRIVLVSKNFSKELTTSVVWLRDHGIDIRCVSITPYKDNELYFDIQQIIPLPELEEYLEKVYLQTKEKRFGQSSKRDLTKYELDGSIYYKNQLVLNVIKSWVEINKPQNYKELFQVFPQDLHRDSLFKPADEARDIQEKTGHRRHYIKEDEIIILPDGTEWAVTNQWSKGEYFDDFITKAKELGFKIIEQK